MCRLLLGLFLLGQFSFNVVAQNSTPQTRAEQSVIDYLNTKFPEDEYTVHNYEFGNLMKITPAEIVEVEKLKKEAADVYIFDPKRDSIMEVYDSLIKKQVTYIKENKIFPHYELNHFFTIKKDFEETKLYESTFSLYPDGKIMDINNHLTYDLLESEYDAYYTYYLKEPLFKNEENDKKTYAYLTSLYENEKQDKHAVMRTILAVVYTMSDLGAYDTIAVSRAQTIKWLIENGLTDFNTLTFSNVSPINDSGIIKPLGYNIKVRLNGENPKAFYVEFDYDYVIRGILPIEAPFDKYFTKPEVKE